MIHKKASTSSIVLLIFEVLVVVLVIFLMVSTAKAFGESDIAFRTNTVEDLRMMIETLVAVPGDALVTFPHNVSLYSFVLEERAITILKMGDPQDKALSRSFNVPHNYHAEGIVSGEKNLCMKKNGRKIRIFSCTKNE